MAIDYAGAAMLLKASMPTQTETARQYLFDYLREEFRAHPEVRVRLRPIRYEEDDGVTLKTESREYFIPTSWAQAGKMKEVEAEVRRIRDVLEKFR